MTAKRYPLVPVGLLERLREASHRMRVYHLDPDLWWLLRKGRPLDADPRRRKRGGVKMSERPTYPKIQSLYKRDPETKFKTFLEGEWSLDGFGALADLRWTGEEKIHGMNIRLGVDEETPEGWIGGRTDRADIPGDLIPVLQDLVRQIVAYRELQHPGAPVTVFGEGCGPGIQKGGGMYGETKGFILFDVLVQGRWMPRDEVRKWADALGVAKAPVVFEGTLYEAVSVVRARSQARHFDGEPEGLVLRPPVELFDTFGNRMICKLKLRDFPEPDHE